MRTQLELFLKVSTTMEDELRVCVWKGGADRRKFGSRTEKVYVGHIRLHHKSRRLACGYFLNKRDRDGAV